MKRNLHKVVTFKLYKHHELHFYCSPNIQFCEISTEYFWQMREERNEADL